MIKTLVCGDKSRGKCKMHAHHNCINMYVQPDLYSYVQPDLYSYVHYYTAFVCMSISTHHVYLINVHNIIYINVLYVQTYVRMSVHTYTYIHSE